MHWIDNNLDTNVYSQNRQNDKQSSDNQVLRAKNSLWMIYLIGWAEGVAKQSMWLLPGVYASSQTSIIPLIIK